MLGSTVLLVEIGNCRQLYAGVRKVYAVVITVVPGLQLPFALAAVKGVWDAVALVLAVVPA